MFNYNFDHRIVNFKRYLCRQRLPSFDLPVGRGLVVDFSYRVCFSAQIDVVDHITILINIVDFLNITVIGLVMNVDDLIFSF